MSILDDLAKVAPAVTFSVAREYDPYFRWDGDGPDPAEEGYLPHAISVYATAGFEKEGVARMIGHYEKPGDVDDDLGGYLPQMLEEAAHDLALQIQGDTVIERDLAIAIRYIRNEMAKRYRKQQYSHKNACFPTWHVRPRWQMCRARSRSRGRGVPMTCCLCRAN